MAETDKASMYRGTKYVMNPNLATSTPTDNQNQSNVGDPWLFFSFRRHILRGLSECE